MITEIFFIIVHFYRETDDPFTPVTADFDINTGKYKCHTYQDQRFPPLYIQLIQYPNP